MTFPHRSILLAAVLTTACHAAEAPPAELKFDLIAKCVHKAPAAPRFPKELTELDGKRVRLTGNVCPYNQHTLRLAKFILTPEPNQGCFACNPPEENAVVLVRLPAGEAMTWKSDTVTVTGTLSLLGKRGQDEESKQFLLTLNDAAVTSRK